MSEMQKLFWVPPKRREKKEGFHEGGGYEWRMMMKIRKWRKRGQKEGGNSERGKHINPALCLLHSPSLFPRTPSHNLMIWSSFSAFPPSPSILFLLLRLSLLSSTYLAYPSLVFNPNIYGRPSLCKPQRSCNRLEGNKIGPMSTLAHLVKSFAAHSSLYMPTCILNIIMFFQGIEHSY
ncbi:hypothetical protein K1719_014930 [Acacia pycnantha]|nr:hypothetical protein K1719_014930 [Acacia pycnantha]